MSALERWQQPAASLDRRTRREIERLDKGHAVAAFNEQLERVTAARRLEGGALLTGQLNNWQQALGAQAMAIADDDPAAGARAAFALDQLAVNGAAIIGRYMGADQ